MAIKDRNRIFDYLEDFNLHAAATLDQCIAGQVERLADFPRLGRAGRMSETRELVITGTAYIATYVVLDDAVLVLRILHSSRLGPE